jgi:hypothetical protein
MSKHGVLANSNNGKPESYSGLKKLLPRVIEDLFHLFIELFFELLELF